MAEKLGNLKLAATAGIDGVEGVAGVGQTSWLQGRQEEEGQCSGDMARSKLQA